MLEKSDGFWDGLLKFGAMIGGAYLLAEILKLLAHQVYKCPHCGGIIEKNIAHCPHCEVELTWKI